MKIIWITSRIPFPLEKGDKLRCYHQLRTLSHYADIYLFAIDEQPLTTEQIDALAPYCREIHTFHWPKYRRALQMLLPWYWSWPKHVTYFFSPRWKKLIQEATDHISPDLVHVHLIRSAPYKPKSKAYTSIDFMDSYSLWLSAVKDTVSWSRRWIYRLEYHLVQRLEAQLVDDYDKRWIISDRDRSFFGDTKHKIDLLPNGIDINYFSKRQPTQDEFDVGFIGNLGYLPNLHAAKYVMEIARNLPQLSFLVAGARADALDGLAIPDNITIGGWYDDIRQAYSSLNVFVAPLFVGSGLQNKVLESMAQQVPVVTTTFVNESIGATAGRTILIADTIEQFKTQILELLNDPSKSYSQQSNASIFVRDNFTWQKQTGALVMFSKKINHAHH